jgi:hypothetical protein
MLALPVLVAAAQFVLFGPERHVHSHRQIQGIYK